MVPPAPATGTSEQMVQTRPVHLTAGQSKNAPALKIAMLRNKGYAFGFIECFTTGITSLSDVFYFNYILTDYLN